MERRRNEGIGKRGGGGGGGGGESGASYSLLSKQVCLYIYIYIFNWWGGAKLCVMYCFVYNSCV